MAPPKPRYPSRPRPALQAQPTKVRRRPTLELPFDDGPVLDVDDPRPQRVPQYPTEIRRPAPRRATADEEALPTTVYEIDQDEAFAPSYDHPFSDSGYKPAFLYVEKGPGQGQLVPVHQGSLVIGRASVSDLRLQHPSVSRRHAQVTRLGERFYLKDLGSQNATWVNKVRIETEIEIYPGDAIQIGHAVLKLRGPAEKVPDRARKQIARAAAKAARRRAPTAGTGTNKVLLGLSCVAIGFGLAAVAMFVALNFAHRQPSYVELPGAAGAGQAALPVPIETSVPVAVPAAAGPDRNAEREIVVKKEPVGERIARERAARPAPKKAAPPSNAGILKLYEAGQVSEAIAAAKAAGDSELVEKLTDFQAAYAAGERAEKRGDGTGAITNYRLALEIDEKLSGGWGKHGPILSKRLGHLYTLVGQHYLKSDDTKNASLAFREALEYDPRNAIAKEHLAAAEAEAEPAQTSAIEARRSAIEEAWED